MKTILHHYYFNISTATERGAYEALKARLNESHAGKFFNVLADSKHGCNYKNETEQVKLDPTFLFANQWNEAGDKGRRLFDWANLIPEALKKASRLIEDAKIETKALTWLLDHEMNIIDNVIFYTQGGWEEFHQKRGEWEMYSYHKTRRIKLQAKYNELKEIEVN